MKIKCYYDKDMLYTNRKIIDLDNKQYEEFMVKSFNGGNSISASIVFNLGASKQIPTYLTIEEGSFTGCRFFVLSYNFIRKDQYNLNLHRDLISESTNWRTEKAMVNTGYTTNSLKYNRWKFNLNVVKKEQHRLTTNLSMAMFFNQRRNTNGETVDFDFTNYFGQDIEQVYENFIDMDDFETRVGEIGESIEVDGTGAYLYTKFKIYAGANYYYNNEFGQYGAYVSTVKSLDFDLSFYKGIGDNLGNYAESARLNTKNTLSKPIFNTATDIIDYLEYDNQEYEYPSELLASQARNNTVFQTDYGDADFGVSLKEFNYNSIDYLLNNYGKQLYGVGTTRYQLDNFNITPLKNDIDIKYEIDRLNIQGILNNVFSYNNKKIKIGNDFYRVSVTKTGQTEINSVQSQTLTKENLAKKVINAINTQYSSNLLYDNINYGTSDKVDISYTSQLGIITLSPEIPAGIISIPISRDYPVMDTVPCKALVINNITDNTLADWMKWAVGVMEKTPEIIDTQIIPFNLSSGNVIPNIIIDDLIDPSITINYLTERDNSYTLPVSIPTINEFVDKESQMVRISSGSFGSSMDITPYLNGGMTELQVRLSVKPMNTIIYIQPDYAGLYGTNFNDKRGLIINEDFSISKIDNAWVNYVYNNRNFENSFNRQIQSIELNNYYMREADRLALDRSDTEAKRLARENTASEWGMFNDLLLGIPSMIGGSTHSSRSQYNEAVQLDTQMNEALRVDNISLQKDLFNNNLGNIKAITPTISRLDTLDIANMLSIVLEIYGCTEDEERYILSYYNNNGANIGTIGTFNEYWGLLISGRIIQSNNYTQLELKELNKRLEGGIYTGITTDNIIEGA